MTMCLSLFVVIAFAFVFAFWSVLFVFFFFTQYCLFAPAHFPSLPSFLPSISWPLFLRVNPSGWLILSLSFDLTHLQLSLTKKIKKNKNSGADSVTHSSTFVVLGPLCGHWSQLALSTSSHKIKVGVGGWEPTLSQQSTHSVRKRKRGRANKWKRGALLYRKAQH